MKHVTKRFLAALLALVLCLSLLPGIALAADEYVKVTSVGDITSGGQFIIVAGGYALGTTLSSGKINGVPVPPGGNTLSGNDLPVWTVEAVSGGIALSVGGQYLGYSGSGTNFQMVNAADAWTVTEGDGGFIITSAAVTTRGIFFQLERSRFAPYATSNMEKYPDDYIFGLQLYKLSDGGTVCAHNYTSEVTDAATCTEDGVETFTCGLCGDSYTKPIAATGHNYVDGVCTNCSAAEPVAPSDPKQIVDEAYALADGEFLPYEATLTGKVTKIVYEYSADWKNITVNMVIEGREDKPIQCYHMGGDDAANVEVGDTITVTGKIKNYKGTFEFDTPTLDALVKGEGGDEPEIPENPELTPAEIVAAAYALKDGESLPFEATLTGKIVSVESAYTEEKGYITVTMIVEGKSMQCYHMTGTDIDKLKKTDTITVKGKIKNYKGTIEFDQPVLLSYISGTGEEITTDKTPAEIVKEAFELENGELLPYTATLTGEIASVDYAYSEEAGDITVTITVEGKSIKCYRLTGTGIENLKEGDTITVKGQIKNFGGTVEFDKGVLVSVGEPVNPDQPTEPEKPVAKGSISGTIENKPNNDATIELLSGGKVIATAKATGTYKFEKLAAGTYTLKVSKKNYVTREYTVTVANKAVTQNVKIHLIGDVDGNGKINVGDVSRIVAFVRKTKALGEYEQLVANVNGGKINVGDVAAVYAHVKGNKKLF